MGEKGMSDPTGDDLKARGRSLADTLQEKYRDEGASDFAWFDALYAEAERERGLIPWSEAAPRDKLKIWLEKKATEGMTFEGLRAADVGCGLGDNAHCLARAGLDVTAFDISANAIDWARANATDPKIKFEVADLLDLPDAYQGAFEFVHETYNLQAMPPQYLEAALAGIASLVAPGGTLLVITRGRLPEEDISGPPRPLTRDQLSVFETMGLKQVAFQEFYSEGERAIRHFLVEYVKETNG